MSLPISNISDRDYEIRQNAIDAVVEELSIIEGSLLLEEKIMFINDVMHALKIRSEYVLY